MPDGDTSIFSKKESVFIKHISQDLVKEFKCDICGFLTYESRLLENHKRCKHEKRRDFKCEACNRLFSLRHIIKAHVIKTHGEMNTLCKNCGKLYDTEEELKNHFQEVHQKIKKPCHLCNALV